MKKYLFLIIILLFYRTTHVQAQGITTGNATAETKVETKVSGESSVTTHIEVEANGEKKVLDSNEEGTHEIKVENNVNTSVEREDENDDSSKSAEKEEKKNEEIKKPASSPGILISFFRNILDSIKHFFWR